MLLESLASMGAIAHGYPENKVAVGLDLNITHLRSATSGRVTGVATALHLGRRTAIYQVEITDDQGRRTAIGRLSCQMMERPATQPGT